MSPALTPAQLDLAVAAAADALTLVAQQDWLMSAHGLEWNCRRTAEHIASCHVGYALLVTGRCTESYLPLDVVLYEPADAPGIVAGLRGTGPLLSSVLTTAPADVVVYHPCGRADLAAVAGMGIIETLVHTWDITQALGGPFTPDAALCAATMARMFPDVDAGGDPWQALLWATGRVARTDRPRRTSWRWTNDLHAR